MLVKEEKCQSKIKIKFTLVLLSKMKLKLKEILNKNFDKFWMKSFNY